ncbi:transposase [Nonomuraea sp. NPDC049129]|uniref:transposase n=1 Tax=Nonomuraea sp. NPDC049129 TaxID=3155272 RepID=UPI0033E49EF5
MVPKGLCGRRSKTTRAHGLRGCRYKGLAKTHVQHVLTAAGTNVTHLADCYTPGTSPDRPPRPISPFQHLCRRLAVETPE